MTTAKLILVTGATGYVGGRLVPRLLESGYQVRVLVRDAQRLQGRPWSGEVEIAEGDVFKPETLLAAVRGVTAAYYLIHSMSGHSDFDERDVTAAQNFGNAAREAGVKQIIYLGGLGDPDADLSPHLRSRQQTGDTLRSCGVPITEFRAAVIVGSGSVSFEMIRDLTERLPMMICPRWVYTRTQPIAIRNVLDYLVTAIEASETGVLMGNQIIEIGGENVLTYGEMMHQYAEVRGLRRWLIPVPVLTPRLSSYWVHWVTPVPAAIAEPLIEGLRNEVIVRDHSATELFPHIHPMDYRESVARALQSLDANQVETAWSDSLASSQGDRPSVVLKSGQGMIIELRQEEVDAPAEKVFDAFASLGGARGWLYWNWSWRLRGLADRLVGGVGFRRGRRHATEARVGDAIDFWRVEAVEPDRLLRLRAEMKVPGRAWLQFDVEPQDAGKSLLRQTAFFAPKGLSGLLYWYVLYPVHALIFSGMIRNLAKSAESAV